MPENVIHDVAQRQRIAADFAIAVVSKVAVVDEEQLVAMFWEIERLLRPKEDGGSFKPLHQEPPAVV